MPNLPRRHQGKLDQKGKTILRNPWHNPPGALPDNPNLQPGERRTLTIKETAASLGISDWMVYEMVKRGEIKTIRIGKRILIPISALDQFVAENRSPTDNRHQTNKLSGDQTLCGQSQKQAWNRPSRTSSPQPTSNYGGSEAPWSRSSSAYRQSLGYRINEDHGANLLEIYLVFSQT